MCTYDGGRFSQVLVARTLLPLALAAALEGAQPLLQAWYRRRGEAELPPRLGSICDKSAVAGFFVIYLVYSTFLAIYIMVSIRSHIGQDEDVLNKVKPAAKGEKEEAVLDQESPE